MATSYRAFQIELYEEYLSNCAFLSEQRRNLLAEPCGKWGALRDWENRIEAQIDGLVVGGDLAIQVCQRRALEGDPGELESAIRVFVRQSKFDLIEQAIDGSKTGEGPNAASVAEGLLHEPHPELRHLIQRLIDIDSRLLPELSRVIGQQRLPLGSLLLSSQSSHPSVVWALGRLREQGAVRMLYDLMNTAPKRDQSTLALALLRITNDFRSSTRWPVLIPGLLGMREYTYQLSSDDGAESSLGLGLLGDPAAVPVLISRLPQPEAALALQLITGAGLTMQSPVEDEDLEEGERQTLEIKIDCNSDAWSDWWRDNEARLPPGCLSCGLPNTTESLVQHLWSPERTHAERYWLIEQLALRDGLALGAEMNMYYKEQQIAVPNRSPC